MPEEKWNALGKNSLKEACLNNHNDKKHNRRISHHDD